MTPPRVTVVLLAYGDEPWMVDAVDSVLASQGVEVDVVVVDNGCTSGAVEVLRERPGVRLLEPRENTGFAGGCNLGAAGSDADFLAFVNGDAVVRPDALAALAAAAADPGVGLVSASIRLADRPDVVNSAGNPVHWSGLSWAGGLGDPASAHATRTRVASVSGATVLCRREVFETLGGFCELMFAYCEDAELSLRSWQHGWACLHVPEAVALHHYEFARNPLKMYLLERNRLLLLLTLLERRTLLLLAPGLLGIELAMLAVAARQGWARHKLRGWAWLLRHRAEVRARRRLVQSSRLLGDDAVAPLLTGDVEPGEETGLAAPMVLRRGSVAYWAVVRRALGVRRSAAPAR